MALRSFVTGSDMCTPSDGAGPSNAMGTLADNLLGRRRKEDHLQELPGIHGFAGPSTLAGVADSAQAAARAAFENEVAHVPGIAQAQGWADGAVDEFLAGSRRPGPLAGTTGPQFAEFERIFHEGSHDRPSFFESAKAHVAFQPLPVPAMPLSVEEQRRIRDRSTIYARHIYADRGDQFADEQVERLLDSLSIDPRTLPQSGQADWDHIYERGLSNVADAASAARLRAAAESSHGPADQWAQAFVEGVPGSWAEEFQKQNGLAEKWVEEMSGLSLDDASQQEKAAPVIENSKLMVERLTSDKNQRFQNSKFLNFVSKMSRGEVILEGNEAKEVAGAEGRQWAHDFAANQTARQWAEEFSATWPGPQADEATVSAWMEEYQRKADAFFPQGLGDDWASEFANKLVPEDPGAEWLQDWDRRADVADATVQREGAYVFAPNNPFLEDKDSFNRGMDLFRRGVLSEAALAFEAEVQRNPDNVEAWRLLGTVHAENEEDQLAISALQQALTVDPSNTEVLLSLGVSYTNELAQRQALSYLHTWLAYTHPEAAAAAAPLTDNSQRLAHALHTFRAAAEQSPGDADLHVALGVLSSLAREYNGAVSAFRAALQLRENDYSLWNKLGATLANSSNAAEAITAYQKALELKPNYMRAWTNMGISHGNVGQYEMGARYYVRALSLNPRSSLVWGYLRSALACSGRMDLMQACEDENLDTLMQALPL